MRQFHFLTALTALMIAAPAGCNQSAVTTDNEPSADVSTDVQTVSFANTRCPIMGGKPTAELTTEYEGGTIGFCCDGCPEKWAALSAEEKAEKFAKVSRDATTEDDSGHEEHTHHEADAGDADTP